MCWREDCSLVASCSAICGHATLQDQLCCAAGCALSDGSIGQDQTACPTPPATSGCGRGVVGGRACTAGHSTTVPCSPLQCSSWDGNAVAALLAREGLGAWTYGCRTRAHTPHCRRTDTCCCNSCQECSSAGSPPIHRCTAHIAAERDGFSSADALSSRSRSDRPPSACGTGGSGCTWRAEGSASRGDAAAQAPTERSPLSCWWRRVPSAELQHLRRRSRLAPLLVLLLLISSGPCAALARGGRSRSSRSGKTGAHSGSGGDGGGGAGCQPPATLPGSAFKHWGCQRYNMMCIDQQQFVSYDPKYNPLLSTEKPPGFDVKDIVYNWPNPYGNGDKFERGKDIRVPGVVIRVNTSEEASPDLQHPVFSACTRPIVLWQRWLYNVGEVFESSYVRMWTEFRGRDLKGAPVQAPDARHSLVLATPHGLRVPRYAKMFFGSLFTQHEVTSLAEFSARRHDMSESTNSTAEGYHVRCFEEVLLCKIRNRMDDGLNSAGAHLLRHYSAQLPAVSDLFDVGGADADTLKVVIASRPNATGRAILNEQELLDACNGMDPQQELEAAGGEPAWAARAESYHAGGPRGFKRVKCVAHVFGRDMYYDLALSKAIDVLVATHGAAGYHSFYMSRGASLVEVMPFHFTPQWANAYYARMLENDKKVLYWQIWIQNSTNAHASAFEGSEVFRVEYLHREHHVTLPWAALQQHLRAILQVGADPLRYKAAYKAGVHCINDAAQPVEHRPDVSGGGWPAVTREELQAREEQEGAEAELDRERAESRAAGGEGGGEAPGGERRSMARRRRRRGLLGTGRGGRA